MKEKKRKAVRKRARFGQGEGEKAKNSPNTGLIRTGRRRKSGKQSDSYQYNKHDYSPIHSVIGAF
ncbi:hypothetical protein AF332_13885 [Sporosarcina globispora]|uniref:Uncharacterized protein n=1 Tax=Sporosarcina globispora TaxID=1459 RepID=A0A0M0GD25_SPOGL|nr:hypothetical protein AF332_13885 [Sporosarcina globispora]